MRFRSLLFAAALTAGLAVAWSKAEAHPHVWVTARSEIVYAPDGSVTGVRHAWTFDDMFSTFALQGLETKTKGVYTREELQPLAVVNVTSLKEFGFFTFMKDKGKKAAFGDPVDYYLEYKDQALVLHFTLPLKQPVQAKDIAIEVFDPTYFVDFQMAEGAPVTLKDAPANCKVAIARPSDGQAQSQRLGEQAFQNGDTSNYGAMFANKISVSCP